jgi:hypothetical protein
MKKALFEKSSYRKVVEEYLKGTISFLLEEGVEFSVASEVEYLKFDPELPSHITERFAPVSLFILSGYTFQSVRVDGERLLFEAGFGEENIGSVVSMPLLSIKQIFVEDIPIAINIAEPVPEKSPPADGTEKSMEALLSNPENQKLLKRKRK